MGRTNQGFDRPLDYHTYKTADAACLKCKAVFPLGLDVWRSDTKTVTCPVCKKSTMFVMPEKDPNEETYEDRYRESGPCYVY